MWALRDRRERRWAGGVFGSWAPGWPPGAGSPEPWPPASLAGKEPRKRPLLFLAGSWDIMTASILETLFKAGEIARFGGEKHNNQF